MALRGVALLCPSSLEMCYTRRPPAKVNRTGFERAQIAARLSVPVHARISRAMTTQVRFSLWEVSVKVWKDAATEGQGLDTSDYSRNPVAFSDLRSTCRSVSRCRNPHNVHGHTPAS